MTKIGYARVASLDGRNLEQQISSLHDAGCETIFSEQISGVATDRPQLAAAICALSAGDELVMISIDRLSRNFDTFEAVLADIAARGATIIALDSSLESRTPPI